MATISGSVIFCSSKNSGFHFCYMSNPHSHFFYDKVTFVVPLWCIWCYSCLFIWVTSMQVSKTAPTGEYLTTGSFMIRGKISKETFPEFISQPRVAVVLIAQFSEKGKLWTRLHINVLRRLSLLFHGNLNDLISFFFLQEKRIFFPLLILWWASVSYLRYCVPLSYCFFFRGV